MPRTVNLATVPTEELVKEVATRKAALKKQLGNFATLKRPVQCPYCHRGPFGVRELARHRPGCKKNPRNN